MQTNFNLNHHMLSINIFKNQQSRRCTDYSYIIKLLDILTFNLISSKKAWLALPVTSKSSELRLALALSSRLGAVARRALVVALALDARLSRVDVLAERPVVALGTALAVDALSVVLAVLAHAPALVAAVDVDAELAGLHLRVVQTLAGVAVALARLALELVALLVGPPLFLDEARTAGLALVAAGVVRTAADELVG